MAISFLKSLLKSSLQALGYDIIKKATWDENLNGVALAMDALVRQEGAFFFLQIGAHDGVSDDPLYDSIVKYQPKGLLVEPLPDKFELLCKNYEASPQLMFENCAVAKQDGFCSLFRPAVKAPNVSTLMGFSSFDRGHLIRNGISSNHIEEITIPACSFGKLLEKYQILPESVSLLQIDTEGFDFEIIKMAFDAKCLPKVIHFEHVQLSFADLQACYHILSEKEYNFAQIGINTLAVHQQF